ncbi:MAG: PilZ domain-containing protein [Chitinivibrionales bacterium]
MDRYEGERRKERDRTRHIEFCPAVVIQNGREYSLLMEDLSTDGARFRSQDPQPFLIQVRDELTFRVRTPYGESVCRGIVEWSECHQIQRECGFGILFTHLSRDPADPLRALIDSGLA